MQSCLPQLVTALSSKRDEMEKLLLLLQDEQRSIIDVDITELEQLDLRKRELLGVMERGNAEYRLLLRDAALELKLEKAESLSPVIQKTPQPLKEKLSRLQSSLLEIGNSLNSVLDFNKGLLENSLHHVRQNLAFFNSLINSAKTYGDAGNMVASNGGSRLVCKEV